MRNEQWRQTNHPVLPKVTFDMALAWGERNGDLPRDAYVRLVQRREAAIRNEKLNPYEAQLEPPWWNLIRALMGRPLRETLELAAAKTRLGMDSEGVAKALREACGFSKRVMSVLLLGGNRVAKTTLEMRLFAETVREMKEATAWALHSNLAQSRKYHMKAIFQYLPQELRRTDPKTKTTYVAYKEMTGFANEAFMLPNGSDGYFKTYEQDRTRAIEGGNINFVAADEVIASDWVETLELRIAERNGVVLVGFTPVDGYSETVRLFLEGATATRWETARLLPTDGGEPDVAGQLGLTGEECGTYGAWLDDPAGAEYPGRLCQWWDVYGWIGTGTQEGAVEVRRVKEGGRSFVQLPVVARCVAKDANRAVVWIHSHNNPWGNPLSVWRMMANKDREWKLQRFYGFALKGTAARFAKFDRAVHVLPHAKIPRDGTLYVIIDPASARNWAIAWMLAREDGCYFVEEWPSQVMDVPGAGVLGEWALPDGKKKDGRPGPAQKSLGWGVKSYLAEVGRVGGMLRGDYGQRTTDNGLRTTDNGLRTTDEGGRRVGFPEVKRTIMDARFANTPTNGQLGLKTLLDECWDAGWSVEASSTRAAVDGREAIEEGEELINGALDWDRERPLEFGNRPHMYFSDRCKNLIYAMESYTGEDGLKGATKDMVDLPRMALLSGCVWAATWEVRCVGGGHY